MSTTLDIASQMPPYIIIHAVVSPALMDVLQVSGGVTHAICGVLDAFLLNSVRLVFVEPNLGLIRWK